MLVSTIKIFLLNLHLNEASINDFLNLSTVHFLGDAGLHQSSGSHHTFVLVFVKSHVEVPVVKSLFFGYHWSLLRDLLGEVGLDQIVSPHYFHCGFLHLHVGFDRLHVGLKTEFQVVASSTYHVFLEVCEKYILLCENLSICLVVHALKGYESFCV